MWFYLLFMCWNRGNFLKQLNKWTFRDFLLNDDILHLWGKLCVLREISPWCLLHKHKLTLGETSIISALEWKLCCEGVICINGFRKSDPLSIFFVMNNNITRCSLSPFLLLSGFCPFSHLLTVTHSCCAKLYWADQFSIGFAGCTSCT